MLAGAKMRNLFITFFIFLGMLINSHLVLADEVVNGSGNDCFTSDNQLLCRTQQGNSTSTQTTTIAPGTYSNLPMSGNTSTQTSYTALGGGGSGAYAQASQAKSASTAMAIAAGIMAAAFGSQCGPTNQQACVLAGVAAGAAILGMMKAKQAGDLMNTLGNSQTSSTTTDAANTSTDQASAQVNATRDMLSKQGYKINADGSFTAPNGTAIDSGASSQNLAAAGLSNSDINGVQSGLADMRSQLASKVASVGESTSTGNGVPDPSAMSGAYGGGPGGKGGATSETGKGGASSGDINRDPAAWDGYFKQYGDSLIGVGQNDIFMMVQKRVESERKIMGQ